MNNLFQPMKSDPVSLRIYDAIRRAIFSWELRPGEPVLESHLSASFKVSQTSVREALLNLEKDGLVWRVPNKGTFVTKLSIEDLKERIAVRMLLEVHASVQAASRMKDEHLKELRRRSEAISTAVNKNAYFELSMADFDFHHYIWENSGNKVLCQTLDRLTTPMFAYAGGLMNESHNDLKKTVNSHEELVSAIGSGKPGKIRKALQAHFDHSYETIVNATLEATNSPDRGIAGGLANAM